MLTFQVHSPLLYVYIQVNTQIASLSIYRGISFFQGVHDLGFYQLFSDLANIYHFP